MNYIVTHKKTNLPSVEGYKTLLAGGVNHPELLDIYLSDSTGDNISSKNNSYCELTGLYWIWKNTNDDIVGLIHYRRYFVKYKYLLKLRTICITLGNRYYKIIDRKEIEKRLERCDILVARDFGEWLKSNGRAFQKSVSIDDIDLKGIILKKYPEYYDAYVTYLDEKVLISKNMFIGKREVIEKYCEWIFSILQDIEDEHFRKYGKLYENRELGYFAEYLFGVWLKKNKINYEFCDYENIFELKNELYSRYVPIYKFPIFCYKYIRNKLSTRNIE